MRTTCDRDSLHEIESKQNHGATRGLLHIKESVYQFFTALSNQVQTQLTERKLHLHLDNIHLECRHFILENNLLLQQWIDLFEYTEEGDGNEVFLIMLIEPFEVITE